MWKASEHRFSVLGLARTGIAAANWLARHGMDVLASDPKPASELPLDRLHPAVMAAPGRNEVRDGDVVIISPGIKPNTPAWNLAHEKGSEVLSDIDLFGRLCPCPIVAITGTDGKSTTTALTGELLKGAGYPTFVGGNIGLACMEGLDDLTEQSVAVLEVSCFQLMHCPSFSPAVALVTNIAEDHVEYHGSFEAYVEAKQKIFANMGPGQRLVLNGDDPEIAKWKLPAGVEVRRFGWTRGHDLWADDRAVHVGEQRHHEHAALRLQGRHNVENVMAAVAAVEGRFAPADRYMAALREFPGLEHRMEFVATVQGVSWYNDSKATNPHAATAVLNAFPERFWLLAGGYEKGSDFAEFGRLVGEKTLGAVLFGVTKQRIADTIPGGHPVHIVENLPQAVEKAAELARPGERVILAPACASFGEFKDFEHRGKVFKDLVRHLAETRGA